MSCLVDRVRIEIQDSRLLESGDRVVVALSGGPDSVALTHVLVELAAAGDLRLSGLAHFNHRLRGDASDLDERFCRELAERLRVPIEVGTAPVRELASRARASIESTAREARYDFLSQAATRLDATRIAVAHTLDDQAETYLLKLLRGAGPRGLAAIHPTKGPVVRPFLAFRRADVMEYLEAKHLEFREDESNADRGIPRNLIRHELLPWLREHVNPSVSDALARGASLARADADWLEQAASEAACEVVANWPDRAEIDLVRMEAQPPALASRIVRLALQAIRPDRFFGFEHVFAVRRLADSRPDASIDLPGVVARRTGEHIVISRRSGRARPKTEVNFLRQALSTSIEACIEVLGIAIAMEPAESAPSWTRSCPANQAVVAVDAVHGVLAVRTRRPGDAFKPLGLGRRRTLQDFFVDRKIPRSERDKVPLVVDGGDRIVWVVGHALAHDFRVTESTRGVVILRFRDLGGAG